MRPFLYMSRLQAREHFASALAYASRHEIAAAWGTLYGEDGKPCRECIMRVRQWRSRHERCTRCGLAFTVSVGRLTVLRPSPIHIIRALGPLYPTHA